MYMCKIIKNIIPLVLHYLIMILNKNSREKFTKHYRKVKKRNISRFLRLINKKK